MVEERRETSTPPRRAPALDSRFGGNDDGGVRAGRRCWWRWALRQAQGERIWEARVRWGVGDAMGDGTPRAAPLWIPAFAGMTLVGECGKDERWGRPRASPLPWVPARAGTTMGGVVGCVGARGWCQGGGPLSRAGGSRTAPTTGVGRTRAGVMRELLVAEGPLRVPSGQASTGSGRTDLGGARAVGSGGCDRGRRRAAPRPSGFLPSQE